MSEEERCTAMVNTTANNKKPTGMNLRVWRALSPTTNRVALVGPEAESALVAGCLSRISINAIRSTW